MENIAIKVEKRDEKEIKNKASRRLRSNNFIPAVVYGLKKEPVSIIVKDFQRDPITREFLHLDFLRIQMEKEIETTVPIHIINEEISIGVKEKDGVLQHGLRELHISCLPEDIPDSIEYDIKDLDMGFTVRVSDINITDKIKILNDPDEVVVSIIHPTQLKEEELAPEEEAGEEEHEH